MSKKIPRSICIQLGCAEISHYKRLCRAHYDEKYPNQPVWEYRFHWTVVEKFEGTIRATSYDEARRLADQGAIAGVRTNPTQGPTHVVLLGEGPC